MAQLIKFLEAPHGAAKPFSKKIGREEAQARTAYTSRTIYIGNLAFVTIDAQLHALFSRCGPVERIIMGLNRTTKQPCGFAFIIFVRRESAVDAVTLLDGSVLDERVIKVEMDKGWYPGREFGRGESGAQVRDELRSGYDEGRGGFSVREQQQQLEEGSGSGGLEGEAAPDLAGDRGARARRFSSGSGLGGGGSGWAGSSPAGSWGATGGSPRDGEGRVGDGWAATATAAAAAAAAPHPTPTPALPPLNAAGGGGWQQRLGYGGGGGGGRRDSYGGGEAGFKRRREPGGGDEYDGGGGGRRRDFYRRDDAPATGAPAAAAAAGGEGREGEGRRRRRGGGDEGGELAEVDEFGRERRPQADAGGALAAPPQ